MAGHPAPGCTSPAAPSAARACRVVAIPTPSFSLLQVGRTFSFTRSASTSAKSSGQLPGQLGTGQGTEGEEAGGGSQLSSAAPSTAATPRGSEAANESSAFYNPYKAAAAVLQQQLTALQVGARCMASLVAAWCPLRS